MNEVESIRDDHADPLHVCASDEIHVLLGRIEEQDELLAQGRGRDARHRARIAALEEALRLVWDKGAVWATVVGLYRTGRADLAEQHYEAHRDLMVRLPDIDLAPLVTTDTAADNPLPSLLGDKIPEASRPRRPGGFKGRADGSS